MTKTGYRMRGKKLEYGLCFVMIILQSCWPARPEEGEDLSNVADHNIVEPVGVRVIKGIRKTFSTQVISNGKVLAIQEIPLMFQGTEPVDKVLVNNGDYVQQGQLIAYQKNGSQKLAVQEALLLLDESKVELNDQLITQGGRRGDSSSVSKDVFTYIKLRSGYDRALLNVQKSQLEFNRTFLYAPFGGVVVNLSSNNYLPGSTERPLCTLLNRSQILVRCPILESELGFVKVNQNARLEPVGRPGLAYNGTVSDINPVVDEQGLVNIVITVRKPDLLLLSGMNVRITIDKQYPSQLVVPKAAVVERRGRKVIFTYENGIAKWHYVTVGLENESEVVILDGIGENDQIIVQGNLNLAHDAKVTMEN